MDEERLKKITPKEFKLENYRGTAHLDAKGWLACLWARFDGDVLGNGEIFKPEPINWEKPLNYSLPDRLLQHSPDEITSVSLLTYDQALIMENIPETYAYLTVDLDMCDEVLKKDFIRTINEARRERKIKSKEDLFTVAKLRLWHDAKILQYMDLCNWHKKENITKVTKLELAQILFPENDNLVDKIRKTVEPKIDVILSRDTIISLLAQMHQRSEQKMENIVP